MSMTKGASPRTRTPRTRAQYEAYTGLLQAAERLQREFAELFKARDLSPAQYNVLRILRGAEPLGATSGEVADRLINPDPDVTRLLDRLEKRGLVARTRETKDRRVVRTRITGAGLALLDELDEPVDALHETQFGHLGERRLAALGRLLQEVRARKP